MSKRRLRSERRTGQSTASATRIVRDYVLDSPAGPMVKDRRIGMVERDVAGVLDGGPPLERMMRTHRLVKAVGDRILRDRGGPA